MNRSTIARLARDDRGVSAVEFALIAPVMVLLYAGAADLCQGYMAFKRTSHVAAAVADLVSQSSTITKAEIGKIFEVGPLIMAPFGQTSMEQRVSSVSRVSATQYTLNWSRSWVPSGSTGSKLNKPLVISDAKIPTDMLATNGASVIVAESYYKYSSPFQKFLPAAEFTRRAYLNPRDTTVITCSDC
ncbi:TadE/TadG family type IV pilus assembly protein [Brevundimonas sp.]|jgi:Flp pilus assembly protein TadG|uniref:TadE/TadG family type IV pilus assembly protein n=1 Tax=Brevundimonas sp. TaxID=1871086 RepID=UPI0037C11CAA